MECLSASLLHQAKAALVGGIIHLGRRNPLEMEADSSFPVRKLHIQAIHKYSPAQRVFHKHNHGGQVLAQFGSAKFTNGNVDVSR